MEETTRLPSAHSEDDNGSAHPDPVSDNEEDADVTETPHHSRKNGAAIADDEDEYSQDEEEDEYEEDDVDDEEDDNSEDNGDDDENGNFGFSRGSQQNKKPKRSYNRLILPPDVADSVCRRSSRSRKAPERIVSKAESDRAETTRKVLRKRSRSSANLEPSRPKAERSSSRSSNGGLDNQRMNDDSDNDVQDHSSDDDFGSSKKRRRIEKRSPALGFKEAALLDARRSSSRTQNNPRVSYRIESSSDEEDAKPAPQIIEYTTEPQEEIEVIERVLDHRDITTEDGSTVREYLLKWKNFSHIHNTWETYEALQGVLGFKKLDNYIKVQKSNDEIRKMATPEECEYYNVLLEMQREEYTNFLKVERIIADRVDQTTGNFQYFVKWKNAPYEMCTWEDQEDIQNYIAEIDQFRAREQQQYEARDTTYRHNSRLPFPNLKEQPQWLDHAGKLRDYQLEGLKWLIFCWCNNRNVILADEMGLGKTVQTLSFLSWLQFHRKIQGPFLVVVPLSTADNWMKEFTKWVPTMNVVMYTGSKRSREIIREFEFYQTKKTPKGKPLTKFSVLLTTNEMVVIDKQYLSAIHWAYLAVDEAHHLKNNDSVLHSVLMDIKFDNKLLITGTPLQNTLKELWSLLHFLEPKKFPSADDFQERFGCLDQQETISELHEELKPYLLRRIKKDVEKSLPAKVERILRVQQSPIQETYYKLVLQGNFSVLKSLKVGKKSLMNIVIELRKICNHPYLFKDEDLSSQQGRENLIKDCGKLMLLHKLLVRLKETGHRVLIFSQMVRMLDILAEYMKLQGFQFQRLDGSMSKEKRQQGIDHFNAKDSQDFCFLLSTRAGGLGINLSTADTVIIYDSDWNPQNDLQAVSRAHRIGQTKSVNIYRLVTRSSVEEKMIERAKNKMVLDHLVIQSMETTASNTSDGSKLFNKDELCAILKFGAEELFCNDEQKKALDEMDIDEILERAETTAQTEESGSELLNQFKFADFTTTQSSEDDATFWSRFLKEVPEKEDEFLGPRKTRTQVKSYNEALVTPFPQEKQSSSSKTKKPSSSKPASTEPEISTTPLDAKEIRKLLVSIKRFGGIGQLSNIALDAGLRHKDLKIIEETFHRVFDMCEACVRENPTEENALVDFEGNQMKAHDFYNRVKDLEALQKSVEAASNQNNWRIPASFKSTNWEGWTPKDDSMLMLGVYKYGIGNWNRMREDEALGLKDKLAASPNEESNKPKSVHLIRRVETLLKLLRTAETMAKNKSVQKKIPFPSARNAEATKSAEAAKKASSSSSSSSALLPASASKKPSRSKSGNGETEDADAVEDPFGKKNCVEYLRPVASFLKELKRLPSLSISDSERLKRTKEALLTIGKLCDQLQDEHTTKPKDRSHFERNLWRVVAKSTSQKGDMLLDLYKKLSKKVDPAAASSSSSSSSSAAVASSSSAPPKNKEDKVDTKPERSSESEDAPPTKRQRT